MRLVDVKDIKSVCNVYTLIPQPMPVYYSYEELIANEENPDIIDSFDKLLAYFRKHDIDLNYFGLPTDARYKSLLHLPLWIKTVDKFIPDYADLAGDIYYITNDDGFISTDGCYTRCFYLTPTPSKFILYCSNGINSVAITKWHPTAAVRSQFLYEKDPRKAIGTEATYQQSLNRMLNKTKPTVDIYKFLFAFLNKDAPSFLDLDKASAVTFNYKIRKADRYKILQSPMFARAMMQVLKILMPELTTEAKKQFPPDKLIGMLAEAAGIAKDTKNVKDILTVFEKVSEIGYEERTQINDTRLPEVPLISTAKPNMGILPNNTSQKIEEPKNGESEDEFYDRLRNETDSVSSFINLDAGENLGEGESDGMD